MELGKSDTTAFDTTAFGSFITEDSDKIRTEALKGRRSVYFAILIQDGAAPRPFQESQTGWQLSAISKIVSEPTSLPPRLDSGYITPL